MSKTQEALKLALEALEQSETTVPYEGFGMAQREAERKHKDAITAIREALAEQPEPPPECKTDAEKTAFAFGWWKALEENRKQPAQQPYDTHAAPGQSFDTHGRTPPAQEQSLQDLWHKVWPDAGAFVRVSADDLTQFARAIEAAPQPAQQQEPVAVYVGETWCGSVVRLYEDLPLETPLYTSPLASKPWVGMTDEELHDLLPTVQIKDEKPAPMVWLTRKDAFEFARAIEAKLREKNA